MVQSPSRDARAASLREEHACAAADRHALSSERQKGAGAITVERLDASTLQVLDWLLPGGRGRLLVELLLEEGAQLRGVELPGVGLVEAIVVSLPSIEQFARACHMSKDTVLRHLDILEALRVLFRWRVSGLTFLAFQRGSWEPSPEALAGLDALLAEGAARPKLQQLAHSTRERFLLLFGAPQSWSSLFDSLQSVLADMQRLLDPQVRLSPTKRSLLRLRLANVQYQLSAEKGDFLRPSRPPALQMGQHEGDFLGRSPTALTGKGDFSGEGGVTPAPRTAQKGDFSGQGRATVSRAGAEKGDFSPSGVPACEDEGDFSATGRAFASPQPAEKGDFSLHESGSERVLLAEKGDFCAQQMLGSGCAGDVSAEKGDFCETGDVTSLNDNGSSSITSSSLDESDNVNDVRRGALLEVPAADPCTPTEAGKLGRRLAQFFENGYGNAGGFVNRCKQSTPITIQAAVVDTLVHLAFPRVDPSDDRGKPRNRAAWFHRACERYQPGMPIPAYVRRWLLLQASWEEVQQALEEAARQHGPFMVVEGPASILVRRWLSGELDEAELESQLALAEGQAGSGAAGTPGVPPKSWMNETEAQLLAARILEEAGPQGASQAVARPDEEHVGVFVVELVWGGQPITMKTPQAWTSHFEGVLRCLRLQKEFEEEHEAKQQARQERRSH